MGVVIYALHGLKKSTEDKIDEVENISHLYNMECFSGHSKLSGWYEYSSSEDIIQMSYIGFNNFRDWCAQIVGYKKREGRVFNWINNHDENKLLSLFFNFADNEGNWDYETCKTILADFKTMKEKYKIPKNEYFSSAIDSFIEVLSNVKKDSVVQFS